MISPGDECSGRGASGECRVDVDNPRTARIEANRNSSVWVLDLDLPLTVERERTRSTAKIDTGAVIEEFGVVNWNRTEKTGRNWNRHGSRDRWGLADRNPGARAAITCSREEGAAEAGDTNRRSADAGEYDLPQVCWLPQGASANPALT
jgi:hypothetical protein